MLAAVAFVLGLTGCSKDDKSSDINIAEVEKYLVGTWWNEFEYADVTETGVPFTRALIAVKVDANHTGCIYLGVFDDTDDLPLAVYGGPKDASFTWQLLTDGSLVLGDPVTGETYALTRATGYAKGATDVANTSMTYTDGTVTMTNNSYSGTLDKADATQEADVQKRLTMPSSAINSNLNDDETIGISDNPQNTWGR